MPTDAGRFDPTKGTWSVSASRPPTTDAVPLGLQQSFFDSLKLRFQAAADPVSPSKAWLVHVHTKGDTKAAIYDLIDGYNSPSVESKPSTWSFGGMAATGRRGPPFQRKFTLKGYQRLMPIGDDAARLIVGLPAVVQARLWRGLPVGTQLGTGISLWALAVFELANANYPLRAARTIPSGEKPVSFKPPSDADWYAMLPDFAAASEQAIDILQSWLADELKREIEATGETSKPHFLGLLRQANEWLLRASQGPPISNVVAPDADTSTDHEVAWEQAEIEAYRRDFDSIVEFLEVELKKRDLIPFAEWIRRFTIQTRQTGKKREAVRMVAMLSSCCRRLQEEAFGRAELPSGWEPDAEFTFPATPIRNANELLNNLDDWLRALREALSDRTADDEALNDIRRELRNVRRATRAWGIRLSTEFSDKPADIHEAERQLELLIDGFALPAGDATPEATSETAKPGERHGETLAGEEGAEAAFEFRPDGDGYFLKGLGESGHVTAKGAKGLRDLFRLVQTPGVPVPMLEFDAGPGVERAEGDRQSPQPVADGVTIKQLAAKRNQLKADIESAGSDMERSELEAELNKLEETAKGMRGLNGTPRDLNNPLDRLRPKLLKRISTAGDKLREARLDKLADHFGLAVSSESGCLVYRPAVEGLTWNVTKL